MVGKLNFHIAAKQKAVSEFVSEMDGHDFGHEIFQDLGHGLGHERDQSHVFGHGQEFRHGHFRKSRTRTPKPTNIEHACPPISDQSKMDLKKYSLRLYR